MSSSPFDDPRPAIGFRPDPAPLRFDLPVQPGGYAWWYLDVVSDDGRLGLTIIAFVGSVFSPRYAAARRAMARGGPPADPEQHCAINLALYRLDAPDRGIWSLTEHAGFSRAREHLQIGANTITWRGDRDQDRGYLEVEIADFETRFGARRGPPLRGRVRLYPAAIFGPREELDRSRPVARHRWYPVAPHARAEVELEAPALRFSGSGYHDVNEGDEGLEDGFVTWNWSRAALDEDRTAILYDVRPRAGELDPRGWLFSSSRRSVEPIEPGALAPATALPRTAWGVDRAIRSEAGHPPRLLRTLENTPFYSRNLVAARIAGCEARAVHESLVLDRFSSRFVQFLLSFKIRRARQRDLARTTSP